MIHRRGIKRNVPFQLFHLRSMEVDISSNEIGVRLIEGFWGQRSTCAPGHCAPIVDTRDPVTLVSFGTLNCAAVRLVGFSRDHLILRTQDCYVMWRYEY